MLPDLPALKRDLHNVLDRFLKLKLNERLGVFNEIPKHMMHEGNRMLTLRADGSVTKTDLKETLGEMSIKLSDIPGLSLHDRVNKLTDIANQMADQMTKHFLDGITEGLDAAGQVVDNQGKPLNVETVFAVLEKLQIEFDESGKHHDLTILIPPALATKFEELKRSFETDRSLQRRYDETMTKKWDEWRDRETTRRLVG